MGQYGSSVDLASYFIDDYPGGRRRIYILFIYVCVVCVVKIKHYAWWCSVYRRGGGGAGGFGGICLVEAC
jgi:hypothetical protein